jgi:hypothetical protein
MSPAGTTLDFVGLAFTDRTNIQVLEQPIRLDYHHTDVKLRTMAARYFGALRKATDKLRRYYEYNLPKLEALGSAVGSDARLPCYSLYRDLADSVERNITYSSQPMPDKLIFFGESDGIKVCVKFVTRYSKEAHIQCASMGIAPILRGFEALPSGWFMVVMDRIDDVFIPLYTSEFSLSVKLRNLVLVETAHLHQVGYVHGDLRDTTVPFRPTVQSWVTGYHEQLPKQVNRKYDFCAHFERPFMNYLVRNNCYRSAILPYCQPPNVPPTQH